MSSTTFSYAQAAKGHTSAQSSSQTTPNNVPHTQAKDDLASAAESVSTTSNESNARDAGNLDQSEGDDANPRHNSDIALTRESTSSNAALEQATHAFVNGDAASADTVQNHSRLPSQASRSTDGDARKGRKSKKSKNSEKEADTDKDRDEEEAEQPKPVILSEAPIPTVNIWQKRIEAQAAKVKSAPAPSSSETPEVTNTSSEDVKRPSIAEDSDIPEAPQSGANVETSHRKSVDLSRAAGEQPPRRNGPRGTRAAEPLPSVSDPSFWPDPRSAATSEEGKRRPQDKVDRVEKDGQDESIPIKRQKDKWVSMPYVPTVNFQTPIPQRSSKPRGGGRGGRDAGSRGAHSSATVAGNASATSPATEKGPTQTSATASKESRPREGSGSTRAAPLPSSASKRTAADTSHTREARKLSAPSGTDRLRDSAADAPAPVTAKGENVRSNRSEFTQAQSKKVHPNARSNFTERRVDISLKGFDNSKEGGIAAVKEQTYPVRERGEGRGERGRGGFRGRGGHNNPVGGHPPLNGFPPGGQYAVQNLTGPQHGQYSPPGHQNAFGNSFGSGPARGGGRGNGRGNPGPASFPRAASNGTGSASKIGHAGTNVGGIDYHMPSFPPYQLPLPPYDPSTLQLLMLQVEYYLSVDNLCKDFFIRKRMDSKGFVLLNVIANFNRMRELAPDVDAIRMACEQSEKIDYVVGEDHIERLRLRDRWDRFVVSPEEREEEARNDGPSRWTWKSRHSQPPYPAPVMPGYVSNTPAMFQNSFPTEDPMYQPQPYMNGSHYEQGGDNAETNGHRYHAESQLSASVPEFSPSVPPPFTLESVTTFSDKQVEQLNVLVGYKKRDAPSTDVETHAAGAVVNGTTRTSEHEVGVNGTSPRLETPSSDAVQQADASEGRSASGSNPKVIWAKKQKSEASDPEEEPYPVFRKKALEQRQLAKPGETPRSMKNLYEFWSHFLIGRFNAKMYEEFRLCAVEDASTENPSKDGLRYLVQYYKALFSPDSPKPWGNDRPVPEIFALHRHGALLLDPNLSTNGDIGI